MLSDHIINFVTMTTLFTGSATLSIGDIPDVEHDIANMSFHTLHFQLM